MKLRNPFPLEVRLLWLGHWECAICKRNGQNRGGLELHHLYSRVSYSAFNSVVLCGYCHSHVRHTDDEHRFLLEYTMRKLFKDKYIPIAYDIEFLKTVEKDVVYIAYKVL